MHQDNSKRKNNEREKILTASGGANGGETFPQLISVVHDLKMGRYSSEIVMKEMMAERHELWENASAFFRNGIYIKRIKTMEKFNCNEIALLPEKHMARSNPDLIVERTKLECATGSVLDTDKKLEFLGLTC